MDNNAHSVFLLYYHLIMVTKYRRKVFDEQISTRGKEIFEYIAQNYGITLEEWNHDADHIHVMFRGPAEERYQQVHHCIQKRQQPSSEKGVPTDPKEAVEGSFLEPELLPSDSRRRTDRSDQGIYRDAGGKGK